MADQHPNIALLNGIDISNLDACADAFADNAVWRFFNPQLPDVAGDYVGLDGIKAFFARMAQETEGTFNVRPVTAWPVGNELVVVQTQNSLTLGNESVLTDVVLVWRFVDGKVTEVWDIPSVFTDAVPLASPQADAA